MRGSRALYTTHCHTARYASQTVRDAFPALPNGLSGDAEKVVSRRNTARMAYPRRPNGKTGKAVPSSQRFISAARQCQNTRPIRFSPRCGHRFTVIRFLFRRIVLSKFFTVKTHNYSFLRSVPEKAETQCRHQYTMPPQRRERP